MKSVLWSDRADQDLEEIRDYSDRIWGADRSEQYIRRILDVAGKLGSGLLKGTAAGASDPRYLRFVVESHVIYYRAEPDAISIIRVLHERMDPTRNL